jgi:hypothetical protein
MRKYLVSVAVLALIGLALVVGKAFAVDATEAINPEAQPMIMYGQSRTRTDSTVLGISKMSAEPTKDRGTGQIYSGECRLYTVTLYSDTAADMIGIYDMATGTKDFLEFELAISANTSSVSANFFGAKFEKGIYIKATDGTNSVVGVVYDY